jgi:DHA1 family arabinose polymer transporter-like MFS transporter
MIGSLLIVSVVSHYKVPAILMTFVTGAIAFAVVAPMQMLMIRAAKGSEMLASSSIQASANMGNALGAWLGGLPIAAGFGYTSPEYVGAGLAFTGLLFCLGLAWKKAREKQREEQALHYGQAQSAAAVEATGQGHVHFIEQSSTKKSNYENIHQQ